MALRDSCMTQATIATGTQLCPHLRRRKVIRPLLVVLSKSPSLLPVCADSGSRRVLRCLGVVGQSEADREAKLRELLRIAKERGSEMRERGLEKVTGPRGKGEYSCTECPTTGRRDRVQAHVLSAHLHVKTWACPNWCVWFNRWSETH